MFAIANDHAGIILKPEIISLFDELNIKYKDFGSASNESCDYAKYAYNACKAVIDGSVERAILICGTGVGMSLAANKVHGIRAVVCSDVFTAQLSRQHNNANVLCLGARVVGAGLARLIVSVFLDTAFKGGRHQRRIDQITKIEKNEIDFL